MEVVGVVAAIPGLIQIIQAVITAVRGLLKRKVASMIVEDLLVQLRDLEDILQDVQKRWKQSDSDRQRLQQLPPALTQLRTELASLQDILQTSESAKVRYRRLRRVLSLSTSLEKTLKESVSRLSQAKTSLTLLIAHHQDEVAEEILKLSLAELRLRLRALLQPSGNSFIPDKTHGTCEWIWSHQAFHDWVNGSVAPDAHLTRTLCLYGIKGCGKSVLVKSIAESFRDRGDICLHFSFWAGSETQRKFIDLLKTVSWQILNRVSDEDLKRLSEPLITDASINAHSLLQVFRGTLPLIGSKVYFAIDGIDESTEDWNGQSNGYFSGVLDLVKSHDNLHLLLAGREPSLRTFLKEACPRLEMTEDLIREDIRRLIAAELNESLAIHTPAIRDMVQESLETKTQVMFLWATLVFKELRRCFSVEEVKQTLKQVPHDLDREYHRLFMQLMTRTGGTLTKPSPSMKRARYLMSSLLACPEPMTAEDLCYSYAAQVSSSGTIEDDLITADGIMDACGDFVRITEGRYHLIHASAADFLTRPENDWEGEDSKIMYFRVDIPSAQASMCSACFTYVKALDLGYPLTDDGALSLPSRHPFFSYAIKFLPFHLFQVFEHRGQEHPETSRFMRTTQFCALVEYLLATLQSSLQNNTADSICYWVELFIIRLHYPGAELKQIYNVELQRRLHCFGTYDKRYHSWQSLAIFTPDYRTEHPTPGSTIASTRSNKLSPKAKEPAFPHLPLHLIRTDGLGIQQLPHNLYAVSQIFVGFGRVATNLLASLAESLSIPMILLATVIAGAWNDIPLCRRLAGISVRKTKGRGDFYELCSLLVFAFLESMQSGYNLDVENLVYEAVRIATSLPVQPHIQHLKTSAYSLLILTLIEQNKIEKAREATLILEKLLGESREKTSSHLWEYGIRHTQRGADYRMAWLRLVAEEYSERDYFEDAENLSAQAIAVFEESGFKPNSECLALDGYRITMLFDARRFDQCLTSSRKLLRHLDTTGETISRPKHMHLRWQTQATSAYCLAVQGDMRKAEKWWCKAADEVEPLGPENFHGHNQTQTGFRFERLAENLTYVGQYDRSESIARKLLEVKGVTKLDDKDVVFHSLGPLVCKLKEIGSIANDYKAFLHCHLLLMSGKLQDEAAEAKWWREQASSCADHMVVPFRTHMTLFCLKSIDTYLHLNNKLKRAFLVFRTLAWFYFDQGNIEAAKLVSSDATSHAIAHLPSGSTSRYIHILESDDCFYTGKLSQCNKLLCLAYRKFTGSFTTEMFFAKEYVAALKRLGEDFERDMRLLFMKQACKHLARAMKADDEIPQGSDGHDTTEYRRARISSLRTQLERLDAGHMLDEAIARLETETKASQAV